MFAIVAIMGKKRIVTSREIGDAVRKRRQELGMSQERLAEALDVSYQQVQRYESGRNKFNVENIQLVAAALSVPVIYFFRDDDGMKVAEPSPPYESSEEKTLFKHFRKIDNHPDRMMVIRIARLAAGR
jgi:transcriptional regulator with XRE-family HTH domain